MGWRWHDDDGDSGRGLAGVPDLAGGGGEGAQCATRRVVQSHCHTEEVEPGRFVRKCEKTERLLRDCVGRYVSLRGCASRFPSIRSAMPARVATSGYCVLVLISCCLWGLIGDDCDPRSCELICLRCEIRGSGDD
jgi:hypothetical protein